MTETMVICAGVSNE